MAVGERQLGAHLAQRRSDAFHGTATERGVAHQHAVEGLSGQDAGQQTHGGAELPQSSGRSGACRPSSHGLRRSGCRARLRRWARRAGAGTKASIADRRRASSSPDAKCRRPERPAGRPVGDGLVRGQLDDAQQASGWRDTASHGQHRFQDAGDGCEKPASSRSSSASTSRSNSCFSSQCRKAWRKPLSTISRSRDALRPQ